MVGQRGVPKYMLHPLTKCTRCSGLGTTWSILAHLSEGMMLAILAILGLMALTYLPFILIHLIYLRWSGEGRKQFWSQHEYERTADMDAYEGQVWLENLKKD